MPIVFIMLISVMGTVDILYVDHLNTTEKAKAGLQECVTKTPAGNTLVVWQKECK